MRDDSGATAIEYAFIAVVVSIVVVASAVHIGTETYELYSYVIDNLVSRNDN